MRSLPVQLDDETLEALEMERRLIGFDSRGAYVQWIIDHRASIADAPDDATALLETYRERIATLEQRLAARTDQESVGAGQPERTADTDGEAGSDPATAGDGGTQSPSPDLPRSDDGWTRSKTHPSVEVRGTPRTTVSRKCPPSDRAAAEDIETSTDEATPGESDRELPQEQPETAADTTHTDSTSEPAGTARQLSPERVVRIKGDPVTQDADVLETVAFDRLDELSRRAVAKTRSRLNRSVETGLEYRSSTTLVDGTVRPGADVADLDSLSVPGHDADVIEARRAVAGHAIAFLRDEGQARKSDFVDALYETHPAGYETADSWWSCLKTALKQVDAIDGGDGRRVWEFTG